MIRRPRAAIVLVIVALRLTAALPCGALSAQERPEAAAGHRGAVFALVPDASGQRILSVGEDGFLVEWDRATAQAVGRFQLSPYAITAVAASPASDQIAVLETDGLGLYRVSVWRLKDRTKVFTLRFKDRVSFLSYSGSGTFLMATRDAREGVALIDAASGTLLPGIPDLAGPVSFAATGKSERTMIAYSTVGLLSYWDLTAKAELKRVSAPPGLSSPVLFGNNLYFGGFDGQDLVVIDAVNGGELSRSSFPFGTFTLTPSVGGSTLFAVSVDGGNLSVREMSVAAAGAVPGTVEPLPILPAPASAAVASGTDLYFGMRDGRIASIDRTSGAALVYTDRRTTRLDDAAVAGRALLALSEHDRYLFPADLAAFRDGTAFKKVEGRGEDRALAAPVPGAEETFLLWRSDGTAAPVRNGPDGTDRALGIRTGVPYRSASVLGTSVLFLDAAGALTVASLASGETVFSFASLGILDAVLNADDTLLAGKSRAFAPQVPLLSINRVTGETAPIEMEGTAVVRLYRGTSGFVYAIVADADSAGPKTTLIRIESASPLATKAIAQYRAEDVEASIAESGDAVATTLGGEGATLIRDGRLTLFERTDALPRRITAGDGRFIVVDSDGGIAWHESDSGKATAILRVYGDTWELDRNGKRLSGPLR